MAWAFDAPTGVYKNHALSSQIREAALENTVFAKFVEPERGFGKGKGENVTITRVAQLPIASKVSEIETLPSGRPVVDTVSVTVSEWGFKIELTEFEESLAHFDMRNKFQRMLRNQMTLTMDKMIATSFKQASAGVIKYHTTSATAGTFSTAGTFGGTASNNMTVAHLREIRDYLAGTLKLQPYRDGNYIGILSTKPARGLKNDSEYREWVSRSTMQPFVTGVLGTIEGITLIETNHYNALSTGIGSGGVTGEAIFFGADAGFLATVLDPELRVGLSEDLGRFRTIGWYGILDAGITWTTAANSHIVHFGSA
jgi:N4-gp56 family major capsid protein